MTAGSYVWQCKLEDANETRGEIWADFAAHLQPRIEQWAIAQPEEQSLQLGGAYWLARGDGLAVMQVSPSGTVRPVRRVVLVPRPRAV